MHLSGSTGLGSLSAGAPRYQSKCQVGRPIREKRYEESGRGEGGYEGDKGSRGRRKDGRWRGKREGGKRIADERVAVGVLGVGVSSWGYAETVLVLYVQYRTSRYCSSGRTTVHRKKCDGKIMRRQSDIRRGVRCSGRKCARAISQGTAVYTGVYCSTLYILYTVLPKNTARPQLNTR